MRFPRRTRLGSMSPDKSLARRCSERHPRQRRRASMRAPRLCSCAEHRIGRGPRPVVGVRPQRTVGCQGWPSPYQAGTAAGRLDVGPQCDEEGRQVVPHVVAAGASSGDAPYRVRRERRRERHAHFDVAFLRSSAGYCTTGRRHRAKKRRRRAGRLLPRKRANERIPEHRGAYGSGIGSGQAQALRHHHSPLPPGAERRPPRELGDFG